jgi:hypothetical protein
MAIWSLIGGPEPPCESSSTPAKRRGQLVGRELRYQLRIDPGFFSRDHLALLETRFRIS